MKSSEFYNKINENIVNLNVDKLKEFVNNIIRKIPENKYKEVLEIFNKSELNIEGIERRVSNYEKIL